MSKKHVAFALFMLLTVASIGLAQSSSPETHLGMVSRHAQVVPVSITSKETLKFTYSDSESLGVVATCSLASCIASAPIYTFNFVCPVVAGKTCTYDIQMAGQVRSFANADPSLGENGLYQFLVDGAPPTGGGTDLNGYYAWQFRGPSFAFGTSYNVHSTVTNTTANEKHAVVVNIACETLDESSGCTAEAGLQTLVVRIWTP